MAKETSKRTYFNLAALLVLGAALITGLGAAAYWFLLPRQADLLIPIEWNSQEGCMVADPPVSALTLRVSGSRRNLSLLRRSQVVYRPALDCLQEGLQTLPVSIGDLLPRGVRLDSVTPGQLSFKVEKKVAKEVFVIVALAGQPAAGYTVTELSVQPERVTLKGPARIMEGRETVQTMPVDVSRARDKIVMKVPLALSECVDKASDAKTVEVTAMLEEEKAIRRITLPVEGRNTSRAFDITPSHIELVVKGPVQVLDALPQGGETASWIDLKGLNRGVYARRAAIILPLPVTLQDASPEVFTVQIK